MSKKDPINSSMNLNEDQRKSILDLSTNSKMPEDQLQNKSVVSGNDRGCGQNRNYKSNIETKYFDSALNSEKNSEDQLSFQNCINNSYFKYQY